jgi:hypothetical protein
VAIELLALDLTTCGRCTRTETNLDAALATVAERLRRDGVAVTVTKTVVRTAEQAERLRFASSPTLRVNGRDIALELRESECRDCGELCGCAGNVACRVWVWQGVEHLEAPEALIVDAVLGATRGAPGTASTGAGEFRLPENLRAFFAAKAASSGDRDCCDRSTCCAPSEKAACCGTSGGCGCRPK